MMYVVDIVNSDQDFKCMYVHVTFVFPLFAYHVLNVNPSQYKHKYHIKDPSQVCPKYVVKFSIVPSDGNGLPSSQIAGVGNNNSARYRFEILSIRT